jgi:hypothetical protein
MGPGGSPTCADDGGQSGSGADEPLATSNPIASPVVKVQPNVSVEKEDEVGPYRLNQSTRTIGPIANAREPGCMWPA